MTYKLCVGCGSTIFISEEQRPFFDGYCSEKCRKGEISGYWGKYNKMKTMEDLK